jgi:hypothetical protein
VHLVGYRSVRHEYADGHPYLYCGERRAVPDGHADRDADVYDRRAQPVYADAHGYPDRHADRGGDGYPDAHAHLHAVRHR